MKFCTNCGSQLEAEDRFCVNCGVAVVASTTPNVEETPVAPEPQVSQEPEEIPVTSEPQVSQEPKEAPVTPESEPVDQPEPAKEQNQSKANFDAEAVNERVQQTKEYAQNYWGWVKTSMQKPFEAQNNSHPFYGMTTFILFSIIGALFVIIPGRQIFGKFSESVGEYGYNSVMTNPFSIGMFLKLLIIFALVYAFYIVIGYLIVKYLSIDGEQTSLVKYTNNFAHFINYTMFFAIAALAMTILTMQSIINNLGSDLPSTSLNVIVGLLAIATLGFDVGFLATFFDQNVKFKIDRIYVVMIAQLVVAILAYFLIRYMIVPSAQNYSSGLFGNVFSTFSNLF